MKFSLTYLMVVFSFASLARRAVTTSVMAAEPGIFSAAYVTVPNEEVAKKIAHGAVSEKLAACVNIIPKITSVYLWEGKIEEDSEYLLESADSRLIEKGLPREHCKVTPEEAASMKRSRYVPPDEMLKTRTSKVDALMKYVKENHPYKVCEVISVQIHNGNPDYLKWISEVVPA